MLICMLNKLIFLLGGFYFLKEYYLFVNDWSSIKSLKSLFCYLTPYDKRFITIIFILNLAFTYFSSFSTNELIKILSYLFPTILSFLLTFISILKETKFENCNLIILISKLTLSSSLLIACFNIPGPFTVVMSLYFMIMLVMNEIKSNKNSLCKYKFNKICSGIIGFIFIISEREKLYTCMVISSIGGILNLIDKFFKSRASKYL